MKLVIEKSVTVITPTVGSSKLRDAIRSVQEQTYSNINHLLVIDGDQYFDAAWHELYSEYSPKNAKKTVSSIKLPFNTGANGFNGQRIYASIPHLINSDYIFFLDEDNWYEPDHVASIVDTMETKNLHWAYSLRKIFSHDKQFIADDNCESLGKWPIYFTHDNPQYLIDTSAFAFKQEFIQKVCHLWHSGAWGEDRRFFYAIKDQTNWDTNYKHTLCYRVDNNPQSVNGDFFIEGNRVNNEFYKGELPWVKN
jgi:glycosyltransferase involved in cell wall biosynthesis